VVPPALFGAFRRGPLRGIKWAAGVAAAISRIAAKTFHMAESVDAAAQQNVVI